MLMIIGITATLLFLLLWRLGVFDELKESSRSKGGEAKKPGQQLPSGKRENTEIARRLEIFEEFFDELSDEEDRS